MDSTTDALKRAGHAVQSDEGARCGHNYERGIEGMKVKQGTVAGRVILAAMFCAALTTQAQIAGDRATASPSSPSSTNQETSSPVSANAYRQQGPPGPSGCRGCFPVKPAGQGPNQESGLPQPIQQQGGMNAPLRRVGPPPTLPNPLPYDLLLQHGHVIDAKNNIDGVMDVGIKDGKIAAVGEHLNPKDAVKTIDVNGDYVTPGLIDIHTHDYASTGEAHSYAGDYGIWPDGFTFRNGVTTICDAGSSGWRNFEDFKEHIIDREQTRVLAFINIVGAGMRGSGLKITSTICRWCRRPGWRCAIRTRSSASRARTLPARSGAPYIQAVGAGNIAHIPVMIDYGANRIERPLYDLLTKYLRAGRYLHAHVLRPARRTRCHDAGTVEGT